jgi:hypothetical protein
LQLPQCSGLLATSTQLVPHNVRVAAQLAEQEPSEQTWPCGQTVLQAPQFRPSLMMSAQPVGQVVNPPEHWQMPLTQACP